MRWSRRVLIGVLCALSGAAAWGQGGGPVRVAVVTDGPVGGEGMDERFVTALAAVAGELEVVAPAELRGRGAWSVESVAGELDRLAAAEGVDLLVTTGPVGSHLACRREEHGVPTLALRVLDASLQGIPFGPPGSGVRNLAYLSAGLEVERRLAAFRELVPVERLALLAPSWAVDAMPGLVEGVAARLGGGVPVVPIGRGPTGVDAALAALPDDADGVCVLPLPGVPDDAFGRLADGLAARGLPSFALCGADDVRRGLLAGLAPGCDEAAVIERGAELARRILAGEPPSGLPTRVSDRERLTIDEATARVLGVWPRFDVLAEAELVGREVDDAAHPLTLSAAMREALDANPGVRAGELAVLAGWRDVDEARASLRPQVDVGLSWTVIDESSANIGRAERSLAGSLSASQVLWSEPTWANLDVQGFLQESRVFEHEVRVLDIARDAAVAYLNVLRARTLVEIRLGDLELTRSNYELAEARYDLGVGVPAEVYRWESRIATGRQAVVDARADLRLAEMELNRVLYRPLEQPVRTADVTLDDPALLIDARMAEYLDDPWTFRVFRDYEVECGLERSSELARIDAAIDAQLRTLESTRRAHWQPSVLLDGSLVDVFDADGEGAQAVTSILGINLPPPEGTTWNASIASRFSLYTGGAKQARARRARDELIRLRHERADVEERVEQRIRSAAWRAGASFTGIRLSRVAAEAARENLELVTDSYSRGVVSIIELLDAQNASLVAEAFAANAVYDFAVDMLEVQRAVGRFLALDAPPGQDAVLSALDRRLEAARGR